MTEAYDAVLRKSLDTVDRQRKWLKNLAILFIVLSCGNVALAMIYLQDLKMLYISTFVGLCFWTGGLAIAILGASSRNAQLVLQAIALVAEASGKTSEEKNS